MAADKEGAAHDDELQFDSAAPAAGIAPGAPVCSQCKTDIRDAYYEVAGHVTCARCAEAIRAQFGAKVPVTAGHMARAVVFGAIAAVAGAAIYLGVAYFLHIEFALIAILVGYMVGRAVHFGAAGRGGRRYQILATLLTYFAISVTYVPQMMVTASEKSPTASAADSSANRSVAGDSAAARARDSATAAASATTVQSDSASASPSIGIIVITVFVLLLIAPIKVLITDFPGSLLSLLIIGVGLVQAWRMNRRVVLAVEGPFKVGSRAPTPDTPAT